MDYDNELTGVLFKNDYKEPGSKKPDFKGTFTLNGQEMDIAAWAKESKNGKKYLSLKVSEKWGGGQGGAGRQPAQTPIQTNADWTQTDDGSPF